MFGEGIEKRLEITVLGDEGLQELGSRGLEGSRDLACRV